MLVCILVIFFERSLKGTKSKERTSKLLIIYLLLLPIFLIIDNKMISYLLDCSRLYHIKFVAHDNKCEMNVAPG